MSNRQGITISPRLLDVLIRSNNYTHKLPYFWLAHAPTPFITVRCTNHRHGVKYWLLHSLTADSYLDQQGPTRIRPLFMAGGFFTCPSSKIFSKLALVDLNSSMHIFSSTSVQAPSSSPTEKPLKIYTSPPHLQSSKQFRIKILDSYQLFLGVTEMVCQTIFRFFDLFFFTFFYRFFTLCLSFSFSFSFFFSLLFFFCLFFPLYFGCCLLFSFCFSYFFFFFLVSLLVTFLFVSYYPLLVTSVKYFYIYFTNRT